MHHKFGIHGMALVVCATVLAADQSQSRAQWPQWGGKDRNFAAQCGKLAPVWSDQGPKKLWARPLGAGYSSICVDGGKVYTMYRAGDDEVVVAMDAETGKTVWEHKYPAPVYEGMDPQFGKGPNATPTIHGDRVYTVGVSGVLSALDKASGKPVWTQDLRQSQGVKGPVFGFSSSPLVYKDSLIVTGGGPGHGVMAFDLAKGELRWAKHDFENLYSSPIVINLGGEDQIALLADTQVVGLSPKDGALLWSHPHENQWKTNISTPVWGSDNLLYVTSGGEAGSKALKLTKEGDQTKVEQVWATRKMAVGQGNTVRSGDFVYGSSGNEGPMFVTAVNVKSGTLVWRERGFARAMLVHGDGKLIILDEEGNLGLAEPTPEALKVISKVQLLKKPAWAAPALVGTRLYIRDGEQIIALELG